MVKVLQVLPGLGRCKNLKPSRLESLFAPLELEDRYCLAGRLLLFCQIELMYGLLR
jgi:hypothetical protein